MTSQPGPITSLSLMPPLRVARLGGRKTQQVDLQPDTAQRQQIAELLELDALRKLRFTGQLRPLGRTDWELTGHLGATVVQPCAITLAPVTSRIDEALTRRFVSEMPAPEGLEVEMPEDDSLEPLGTEIDISALVLEALSLALPAFPRAEGAELTQTGAMVQPPKGHLPLENERPKPFAGLAALKDTLSKATLPKPDGSE